MLEGLDQHVAVAARVPETEVVGIALPELAFLVVVGQRALEVVGEAVQADVQMAQVRA